MAAQSTWKTHRRDERGFTFSELALVLVFVVGLLVVITASVRGIRHDTSTSNCQTQLRTLKLATEQYHAKNQAYPNDTSVLVDSGLVKAAEVADWTVQLPSTASEPTFEAVPDSACQD
ncbi:MAG: hypothetical protein JWM47_1384 [Acidimicrobiales bacterium]|nr:hypothetical protein [Acidimicrobiales bacterium]